MAPTTPTTAASTRPAGTIGPLSAAPLTAEVTAATPVTEAPALVTIAVGSEVVVASWLPLVSLVPQNKEDCSEAAAAP